MSEGARHVQKSTRDQHLGSDPNLSVSSALLSLSLLNGDKDGFSSCIFSFRRCHSPALRNGYLLHLGCLDAAVRGDWGVAPHPTGGEHDQHTELDGQWRFAVHFQTAFGAGLHGIARLDALDNHPLLCCGIDPPHLHRSQPSGDSGSNQQRHPCGRFPSNCNSFCKFFPIHVHPHLS